MEEKSEELNIDFGKIRDFFKKLKQKGKEPGQEETSIESSKEDSEFLDFSNVKKIIVKNKVLFFLLLIIVLQFIPNGGFLPWGGIWMRMQSQNLPQIDIWAENTVNNFYKNQIADQISKTYPHLPDENKNKLIDKELNKILTEEKDQINAQIEQTAIQFRERFQYEADGKKYNYMPDIDPYTYLRFVRNKIETGRFEDSIKDGITWDDHSLAPIGRRVSIGFHHYFLFFIHKAMSMLNPKIPVMQTASYFPIIMILLSILPAFFIGKRLAGYAGGFFAASMLVLNAAGLGRTPWGHADTDAYNIFFPLLIIWLFVESIAAKNYKKKFLFSVLSAFSVAVFSRAWAGGWWYVIYFILIAMAIHISYLILIHHKKIIKNFRYVTQIDELKYSIFITFVFLICSGIFISITSSPISFINAFFAPFHFVIIKSASHPSLWPNVYTTVAELNPASISSIINNVGGKLLFFLVVLGSVLTLTIKDNEGKRDIKYAVLLIFWILSTVYASTKGIRFILLMVPAFSIGFGVTAGILYRWITKWMKKDLKIPVWISGAVIIIIFMVLLISPVKMSYANVKNDFPIINDAWWNALTKIKEESAPNAIINSWWDFGHHFKYIADRAVTFDGATQNYPHAHWIGNVLLTDNEEEAVGILRMLDCGSNRAFEVLDEEVQDTVKSVDILYKIIAVEKDEAEKILKEYVDNPEEILQYTHCDPPENYFITSDDMINKAGVWAHFGGWNFERADIWMNMRKLPKDKAVKQMKEKFGYNEEKAETIYFEVQAINDEKEANNWISPWPGFASGLSGCEVRNNIIKCGNGAVIKQNNSEYDALLNVQNNAGIPQALAYIDRKTSEFVFKEYKDSNVGVSVLLIPSGGGYTSVLVSKEIAASMFTRLFFFNGHGLKHFDLFDEQRQVTGGMIYVWTVDWEGHGPNIHSDLIKKEKVDKGDSITVEYIGWLEDETVFDSSIIGWKDKNITKDSDFDEFDNKPLKFTVDSGQMIAGFDKAVIGMKKEGIKIIQIPPEEAYGLDPEKHPMGNKTLNFKIKVVEID